MSYEKFYRCVFNYLFCQGIDNLQINGNFILWYFMNDKSYEQCAEDAFYNSIA